MRPGVVQLLMVVALLGIPCAIIILVLLCVKAGGGKDRKTNGRICLACGCMSSANAKFCENCGKPLPVLARQAPCQEA